MKTLPIIAGCSLSRSGVEDQAMRAAALRPSVVEIVAAPGSVVIHFADGVDSGVLAELVEVERDCCSFLEINLDQAERTLSIGSNDPARAADVAVFARMLETTP